MLGQDRLDDDQITPVDSNRQADQRARDTGRKGPRPPESSDVHAVATCTERALRKLMGSRHAAAVVQRSKSAEVPLKLRPDRPCSPKASTPRPFVLGTSRSTLCRAADPGDS